MSPAFVGQIKNINIVVGLYKKAINKTNVIDINPTIKAKFFLFLIIISNLLV